jgi:hypothetical protein
MEWFKRHSDSIAVISVLAASMVWMNGKFSDIDKEISGLKTDVAIIKTVMLMNKIMPTELAHANAKPIS